MKTYKWKNQYCKIKRLTVAEFFILLIFGSEGSVETLSIYKLYIYWTLSKIYITFNAAILCNAKTVKT